MGKPKALAPPDPIKTGAAQTGTNVATAIANQVGQMTGQVTPYGTRTYAQTGSFQFRDPNSGHVYDMPTMTMTEALTPAGQRLQDANMATQQSLADIAKTASGRVGGLLGQSVDMSAVTARGAMPTLRGYEIADRGRVEEALMGRLAPQLAQDRAGRENALRQQGITPGSSAWDREMGNIGRQENDARLQVVLAGGQEQSRMTGLSAGKAAFDNSTAMDLFRAQEAARAASLAETYQARSQPLNEISALLGGAQVQAPTFSATPALGLPTTDYAGLINANYDHKQANYQQQMKSWDGLWGGLMGGAAGLFQGRFGR